MKYVKYAPLSLLFPYITLMFFRPPAVSDAFVVLSLVTLQAFGMFLEFKKETASQVLGDPNLVKLREELEKEQLHLKIHEVKTDFSKKSLAKLGTANGSKISW